jgi:peptidyl-prolyl cis-trans isomerase D
MGMTADQYAQALRNQLTTQQLINAVAGTDFMLKGETDELAALVSQQRVVREATIDVNALAAKQQVSDEKLTLTTSRTRTPLLRLSSSASYIKLDAAACRKRL